MDKQRPLPAILLNGERIESFTADRVDHETDKENKHAGQTLTDSLAQLDLDALYMHGEQSKSRARSDSSDSDQTIRAKTPPLEELDYLDLSHLHRVHSPGNLGELEEMRMYDSGPIWDRYDLEHVEHVEDIVEAGSSTGRGESSKGAANVGTVAPQSTTPSDLPPITGPPRKMPIRRIKSKGKAKAPDEPAPSSSSSSAVNAHHALTDRAPTPTPSTTASSTTYAKEKEKINPKDFPGRFPLGNAQLDLGPINLALGQTANGEGTPRLDACHGAFPPFLFGERGLYAHVPGPEMSLLRQGLAGMSTGGPQQGGGGPQNQQGQGNAQAGPSNAAAAGNGNATGETGLRGGLAAAAGVPMNAGQQMDVHMLYQKVVELSEVLKENREQTRGIINGAEELASRAVATGASPSLQEANVQVSAARVAELQRKINGLESLKTVLLREQRENTKLIGEYETALGHVVELVRNFAHAKDVERLAAAREYNRRLQEERDAHLATRLERDAYMAQYLRKVEQIRHAYRLRCEEEEAPTRVVAGLQNEVRAYRAALGMAPEKFEDEFGYEILKDVKNGAGEP